MNYYKVSYDQKWFFPISRLFTLMLEGEIGWGEGYAGDPFPFFKNFFAISFFPFCIFNFSFSSKKNVSFFFYNSICSQHKILYR